MEVPMSHSNSSILPSVLRLNDVIKITGLSRSTIYRSMKSEVFPQSIHLSPGRIVWLESDILEWFDELEV
jgi:prophage regulatory protein